MTTFLLRFFVILVIFNLHHTEWVEITQTPKPSIHHEQKPNSIRILKKNEAGHLNNHEENTPSPQWIEYQRERFGQRQNMNTQKLVVTGENRLKNSVQVIVPANKIPETQLIQTRTSLSVVNDKSKDRVVELPHVEPQTTTRRDMSGGGTDKNEYIDIVDDVDNDGDEEDTTEQTTEAPNDTELQKPSLQGFIKFLKTMTRNWLKHSGFSFEKKIRVLKNLRNKIMHRIEEQFTMLWTPTEHMRRRRKRGILDESTITFPPEVALMSLNFLTFAVFLIKLVLQIVHLVKSKHYNITGLGVTNFGKTHLQT